MKKTLLLLMPLFLLGNLGVLYAQKPGADEENMSAVIGTPNTVNDNLDEVTKPATFIGDYAQFVKKNLVYPYQAIMNHVTGKVVVRFVINTDGSISNIAIHEAKFHTAKLMRQKSVDKFGKLLSDEALRITKLTSGQWEPARDAQDNKVASRFELPFNFHMD